MSGSQGIDASAIDLALRPRFSTWLPRLGLLNLRDCSYAKYRFLSKRKTTAESKCTIVYLRKEFAKVGHHWMVVRPLLVATL